MFNTKRIKTLEQRVGDLERTNAEQSKRIDDLLELIELLDRRLIIRDVKTHATELDQLMFGRLLERVAILGKMTPLELKEEFMKIAKDVERAEALREAERIAKLN